jgi:hypothetical protein
VTKLVRLEVIQNDADDFLPPGSVFLVTKTGEALRLFRRKHRDCDANGVGKQTWWVKRG